MKAQIRVRVYYKYVKLSFKKNRGQFYFIKKCAFSGTSSILRLSFYKNRPRTECYKMDLVFI